MPVAEEQFSQEISPIGFEFHVADIQEIRPIVRVRKNDTLLCPHFHAPPSVVIWKSKMTANTSGNHAVLREAHGSDFEWSSCLSLGSRLRMIFSPKAFRKAHGSGSNGVAAFRLGVGHGRSPKVSPPPGCGSRVPHKREAIKRRKHSALWPRLRLGNRCLRDRRRHWHANLTGRARAMPSPRKVLIRRFCTVLLASNSDTQRAKQVGTRL